MITRGQKINERYEIIKNIGEGGMANVYLAHDLILDRDVAVKILRGDLATDEKFVRRFQREAIAASSLAHPNIVEMYDVGEDNGKYFIVMEYVQGKTLKSLIKKRGALTLSETIDIMLQLTSGLCCAHDSYIIHRDIKPQNVLILDDGRVKITDFGIAVALKDNELTQTNSVMGSVHYLPPEQANGTGSTVQSDIYSAGILMYELLIGKLPFKGENAVEIAIKQMKDPIPSVCMINPDIPQSVENIIIKATAKNPKNRYKSSKEMYDDLKTSLNEERKNEEKIVFDFPEQEFETMAAKENSRLKRNADKVEEEKKEEVDKKSNKLIIITSIIIGILIIIGIIIIFVFPMISKSKEVEVPSVNNMTVDKATQKLKKLGLSVDSNKVKKYSSKIKKGKVIKTSPGEKRIVKKGTKVTLTVSKGSDEIKIEDYTGKDFTKIKKELEEAGLVVDSKEEEHTKDDNIKENSIISQDVEKNKKLKKGDIITFTIPKMIMLYPDFVNEGYTLAKVEQFCDENNITLESIEKETNEETAGSIIYQSRTAGSKVISGVILKVTVAKKVSEVEVSGITLNKGDQELAIGDSVTLEAVVNPSNATNKNLTWKSSNTGVVTVNSGRITAIGEGKATITVSSSNGKTNSITVSVTKELRTE